MTEKERFGENAQSVQAHLTITQAVIQRMATNSVSCKTWCITLVSAILVVVADKGKSEYALIALVPCLLFLALDTYYLALERMFRKSYNNFIEKLHEERIGLSDLYTVTPSGCLYKVFLDSMRSFSIYPFYLTLIGMILVVKFYIL